MVAANFAFTIGADQQKGSVNQASRFPFMASGI